MWLIDVQANGSPFIISFSQVDKIRRFCQDIIIFDLYMGDCSFPQSAFCHPSSWPGLQSHSRRLGPQKKWFETLFFVFFYLWCMMWYLDILMQIPKPKVSRFGQINTARLWREWEQAEAAEVGLVRGLQFRFERNWGEDRSIDVANELQSKLSATFFQRKLQIWLIWSSMQLLCWQMNIIYGVSSPFVLVQTIFTLSLCRGPQWILGRIIPWFAACVFSGTKVDSFTGRFRSRLKLLKLAHGVFIRDTYSIVNVNVLY